VNRTRHTKTCVCILWIAVEGIVATGYESMSRVRPKVGQSEQQPDLEMDGGGGGSSQENQQSQQQQQPLDSTRPWSLFEYSKKMLLSPSTSFFLVTSVPLTVGAWIGYRQEHLGVRIGSEHIPRGTLRRMAIRALLISTGLSVGSMSMLVGGVLYVSGCRNTNDLVVLWRRKVWERYVELGWEAYYPYNDDNNHHVQSSAVSPADAELNRLFSQELFPPEEEEEEK